jgi:hypothetical protein
MAALSLSIDVMKPLNRWDYSSIRPGSVGSVGDVNMTPRLKHSHPDMPLRFDRSFSGKNSVFLGSNVQNGTQKSYDSGGGPARTVDSNWGGRRRFQTRHGYIFQDIRTPDDLVVPVLGTTPSYSWRNKVATNFEAKRTGELFLPLPGGYDLSAGQVPRGGTTPRITDIVPGTTGGQGYSSLFRDDVGKPPSYKPRYGKKR